MHSRSRSKQVERAALRILKHWDDRAWSEQKYDLAIREFVRLSTNNAHGGARLLTQHSDFSRYARWLDITPSTAAAFLRERQGVSVHSIHFRKYHEETRTWRMATVHRGVTIGRRPEWIPNPVDWLYIASLQATADRDEDVPSLSITVRPSIDPPTLVECLKCLRKAGNKPFRISLESTTVSRDALMVLRQFPGCIGFSAHRYGEDITDEDWADCIRHWPRLDTIRLSASAGKHSIAAAAESKHLLRFITWNADLTEKDVSILRNHPTLLTLKLWKKDHFVTLLGGDGKGKWQLEGNE